MATELFVFAQLSTTGFVPAGRAELTSRPNGADYPNRTDDLPLTRRMLYQLS
jgi:hypothetical protein